MADFTDPDLILLHLSDIHFRRGVVGDAHDEDQDLRNELERDLRRLSATYPKFDGIIVSGDIAFAGKAEEYEFAKGWLESIRELLSCPKEGVMLTPGNHDKDRDAIPADGEIARLHKEIRDAPTIREKHQKLVAILRNPALATKLLEPLQAYNNFAGDYGCAVSPDALCWERRLALRNGALLCFKGLTTTLISDGDDDELAAKLIYGSTQLQLQRRDNESQVVIGHHPPSWTFEGDRADQQFGQRTIMQFFGHKHEKWHYPIANGVRLIGGAMHPARNEPDWDPRFSAIALKSNSRDELAIRIYPRRWSAEATAFIPDYDKDAHPHRDYLVTLQPPDVATQPGTNLAAGRPRRVLRGLKSPKQEK